LNDEEPFIFKCPTGFVIAPNNWFIDNDKESNAYEFGLYS